MKDEIRKRQLYIDFYIWTTTGHLLLRISYFLITFHILYYFSQYGLAGLRVYEGLYLQHSSWQVLVCGCRGGAYWSRRLASVNNHYLQRQKRRMCVLLQWCQVKIYMRLRTYIEIYITLRTYIEIYIRLRTVETYMKIRKIETYLKIRKVEICIWK